MQSMLRYYQMECVRLANREADREEYVRFLEEEVKTIAKEVEREFQSKIELIEKERDTANAKLKTMDAELSRMSKKVDSYEKDLAAYSEKNKESLEVISSLEANVKELSEYKELADTAAKASMDAKDIIRVVQRRVFQRNSDATRYLNGEIDAGCPYIEDSSLSQSHT